MRPTSTAADPARPTGQARGALCASGWCDASGASPVCALTNGCQQLKSAVPATSTGVYVIDADPAVAPTPPFSVYCDMDYDGGGWTLVMKLTTGATFEYASAHWTAETVVNEVDAAPNTAAPGTDAKLAAFSHVRGSALRLEWLDPPLHNFRYGALADRTAL